MSFQGFVETGARSACGTREPSGSRRSSCRSADDTTSSRPAGKKSMHIGNEATSASFPMCIDFLPDGRLLVVSSADRQLLRREPDGSLVPHADLAPVSTKPWNDIVVDGRGNAYVNGIGFDFPGEDFVPGIVVLVTHDGKVTPVADGLAFPNGMAITADESTLIVAESYAEQLTAYNIADDGILAN